MQDQEKECSDNCPVFGVESGVPVIGLGVLVISFGIIPLVFLPPSAIPVPLALVFVMFGIFLIWIGATK